MPPVFAHEPVMADEVVALFGAAPAGWIIDATAGGGGHAAALLDARADLCLLCIDRDPDAVAAASERLAPYGARASVRHGRFDRLVELAADAGIEGGAASGVLFDLGVSSPQLDRPERGFSYRIDAPLDMRMDPDDAVSAAQLLNDMDEDELARLFARHGEGRFSRRIAHAVVSNRPIETTGALADVVRAAIPAPARRRGGHPARRVFQALRAAVNDELDLLESALPVALDLLRPGGRLVTIAYHSGEDRIVKAALSRAVSGGCVCPPGLPCTCGATSLGTLVFRGARRPSRDEVARNRRSESARLRAFERTAS
jgi:16S rRNA (cytosine1402-N4)-methyltransferase